jgi:hypothetical protein
VQEKNRQGALISLRNQRGVTAVAEHAITILLVVATLIAMTAYVRRSLQARVRDARHYMIQTINSACVDTIEPGTQVRKGCRTAANINGLNMSEQYEPYYTHTSAAIEQDRTNYKRLFASSGVGNFVEDLNTQIKTSAGSDQWAPIKALEAH